MEKNKFEVKYTKEIVDTLPTDEMLDVLFYQYEKGRVKFDFSRRYRKLFFKPATIILGVMSLILLVISIMVLIIGGFVEYYIVVIALVGIFFALVGIFMTFISILVMNKKWRSLRKKLLNRFIRLRYRLFSTGLTKNLPYDIEYSFENGIINQTIKDKEIHKSFDPLKYDKIVETENGFLFFQRDYSPSYKFSIITQDPSQKSIVHRFLSSLALRSISSKDVTFPLDYF